MMTQTRSGFMRPMAKITCLVGNGLSIAYNQQLSVPQLTTGIKNAFEALAGTAAGNALAGFAQQVTGDDPGHDFERLLGPLDSITQALPFVHELAAAFGGAANIEDAFGEVEESLRTLHRKGLAAALDLVATRAHGQGTLDNTVKAFCQALHALPREGVLTIGTLNYDGLVHAALLDLGFDMADLAMGFPDAVEHHSVIAGGPPLECWPIRDTPDLPGVGNVHVLQLHGSLGWLRGPNGGIRKFRIDELREQAYWEHLADDQAVGTPVVVLTDRKLEAIGAPPFDLAYRILRTRLIAADKWLIAGYGFADKPVNAALADALTARQATGEPNPDVLVIGHGNPDQIAELVAGALALPEANLHVDGQGVPACLTAAAWTAWAA